MNTLARGSSPAAGAVTERAGSQVGLANFAPTRRDILTALKKQGELGAEELALAAAITVSAVRQHLRPLEAAGLLAHRVVRAGPGRPRHCYRLTPAAEVLFPKRYGELTNQLLGFVADVDAALIDIAFDRRRQARVERAAGRLAGKPFDQRVRALAAILDEDGYLADCEAMPDGTWRLVEHNCAILDVARRYGNACTSEIAFLREALPEADVQRVAHMIAGAHVCAYEISPRRADAGS